MKHKIIKTENYLLVVDDSEIKEGDWIYDVYDGIVKVEHKYQLSNIMVFRKDCHKIIAHLPLNNSPILEEIPLLPPFTRHQENGIDEFSKECNQLYKNWLIVGYKAGYNKANEKYKFTEEHIYKAIQYGREVHYTNDQPFIQSLLQPKIPVGFECIMVECARPMPNIHSKYYLPKTITNSQGNTVWVGEYIY